MAVNGASGGGGATVATQLIGAGAIAAPYPLQPPAFSLLTSAAQPRKPGGDLLDGDTELDPEGQSDAILNPGDPMPRWVAAIRFAPEMFPTAVTFDPAGLSAPLGSASPGTPPITLLPVGIEVADQCSTLEYRSHPFLARVTRAIRTATPSRLGAEFWTGAVKGSQHLQDTTRLTAGTAPGNVIAPNTIAGDVTPTGGAAGGASPARVLAELEGALRGTGYGQDGMIHAEPRLVTAWAATQDLHIVGNRLYTLQGTIVVADPGYPGTGPDGTGGRAGGTGSSWAYATDMVTAWTSPIELLPDDPATNGYQLTAASNTITYRAQRVAVAGFDSSRLFTAKALIGA